jgi:saccharopine dehydrogenase-like NADP-dependent oxidoreductase
MHSQFETSKKILEDLLHLVELEEKAEITEQAPVDDFMMVNETGDLQKVAIEDLKTTAAATVAYRMHEAKLTLKQLFFLGMDDEQTIINKGLCSAADILQLILEEKLALLPGDRDMVIMLHEIEYKIKNQKYKKTSTLIIKGEDDHHTAMAKTVGLPLGIAAKAILNGVITTKGLQIPVLKEIYEPVLKELSLHDILFTERNERT